MANQHDENIDNIATHREKIVQLEKRADGFDSTQKETIHRVDDLEKCHADTKLITGVVMKTAFIVGGFFVSLISGIVYIIANPSAVAKIFHLLTGSEK